MSVNDLSQSMLDTIQLMSTKAANSSGATLTVKCTITNIIDAGLGLYEVSYGDNKFNAYSNTNTSYKISDNVYVLVPGGDFSQEKIIVGATAPKATLMVSEEENSDIFVPISENLFGTVNQGNVIELKSWEDTEITNIPFSEGNFGNKFKNYSKDYKTFVFSANIKTAIDKDHQMKGNYGLLLTIPYISRNNGVEETIERIYNMDISTMQGNPYNFEIYQKIKIYYTAEESLEYAGGVPTITAFVSGFGYNEEDIINKQGSPADIFIKDIKLEMVDVLTEEEKSGYSLTIVSENGNLFTNNDRSEPSKILTPQLKIKGKDSNIKSWKCYWFVEDSSVSVDHRDYLTIGGIGWKCLNEKTNIAVDDEGNRTFDYVENVYKLEVKPTDVKSALRYKCILIQNEITVIDTITLSCFSLY